MPRISPEEKLKKLKEKEAQLKAQFQKVTAHKKEVDRKMDTRRKVLTGAVVLKACETDGGLKKQVWDLLEKNLVLNKDRVVFGFAQKPEPPKSSAPKP